MLNPRRVNEELAIGPQPGVNELADLRRSGFRSVVNLRASDELDQPMSPDEERRLVEDMEMEYLSLPVAVSGYAADAIHRFLEEVKHLPKPVYVHSRDGNRSGVFAAMYEALEQGLTGDAALRECQRLGVDCDEPGLREFVTGYVNEHAGEG